MTRNTAVLFFCAFLGALPAHAGTEKPKQVEFMPVADIRPGMSGYGLTVFEGTKVEKFDVKVIGVINGFLPKQDIILIEALDPRIIHSGIVGGMSGSPIYIEGKLAGALAYGWPFGKDPIAGVTPIKNMLDLQNIPTRGIEAVTRGSAPETSSRSADAGSSEGGDEAATPKSPYAAWTEPVEVGPYTLVPASTPLTLSGFGPQTTKTVQKLFSEYGIEVVPMLGGASGMVGNGQATYYQNLDVSFEPGSAIGVTLMSGDIGMTSTGTVTYVDGNKVFAFGHPMMNMGETYFPINTAWIHMILASQMRSFKISSPIKEVGSLIQDRQAAIYGDISKKAPMIPMTVTIENLDAKTKETFKMEAIRHPLFTPLLVRVAVEQALEAFAQDIAPATYAMESNFKFEGYGELKVTDHFFSSVGMVNNRANLDKADSLKALRDVMGNPFGPIAPEKIDVKISVRYSEDYAVIKSVQLKGTEVRAGDRVNLYVTVSRFGKPDEVRTIPIDIPLDAEGQSLEITVESGSQARPELATPENISGMLANYKRRYSPRSFVVTAQLPSKGVTYKGRVIPSLPGSVLDSLNPDASTERAKAFKTAVRFSAEAPELIFGKASLKVKVQPPAL